MTSWSLSKLGTFEKCPAKYKYRYLDKLVDPPGPSAARGTAIHATVEQYMLTKAPLPEEFSHYTSFLDNVVAAGGLPEVKLAVDEEWQPTDFSSGWLRAVLDALIIQENSAILYDWKTGKEYDDHYDQKQLYALCVFSHYPEVQEVRSVHVYVDHGKNTERTYHRSNVPAMQSQWNERARKLLTAESFYPNPNYGCRWCSYSRSKGGPCKF